MTCNLIQVAAGGQRVLDMYHQCQERSEFYSMVDLSRLPVLFTPDPESCPSPGLVTHQTGGFGSSIVSSVGGGGSVIGSSTAVKQITDVGRRKAYPPSDTRMVVYVRQENEEIYTPLHLVPPTVTGRKKKSVFFLKVLFQSQKTPLRSIF